jgi:hypothetical protein
MIKIQTAKITLKLVRSFSIGFTIYSPKYSGLSFEINFACFSIQFWNRGTKFIQYVNFWRGY